MIVDIQTRLLSTLKAILAFVSSQAGTTRLKKAIVNTLVAFLVGLAWLGAQSLSEYCQCNSLAPGKRLNPEVALQFVYWWSQKSMDFEVATARQSHADASGWMRASAIKRLDASIWYPCEPGKLGDYFFSCTGFHAPLVKDPKTITVGLSGVLLTRSNRALPLRLITINFDVIEEPLGLRIADARIVGDSTGQYTADFLADEPFDKHSFDLSSFIDRNIGRW